MVAAFPQTSAQPSRKQSFEMLARMVDGSQFLCAWPPLSCGVCGEQHCFFVNRNGTTRCVRCDAALPLQPEVP